MHLNDTYLIPAPINLILDAWHYSLEIITPTGQSQSRLINGQGTEVLLMVTSDRFPSHPAKDGRATDSCSPLLELISVAY